MHRRRRRCIARCIADASASPMYRRYGATFRPRLLRPHLGGLYWRRRRRRMRRRRRYPNLYSLAVLPCLGLLGASLVATAGFASKVWSERAPGE
eukprot:4378192-Pyramimonas_sp.AAC.1